MIDIIEAQCLNYILDKKSMSFIIYNNLDETYFPTFLQEYRFIKDHYDRYGNVPDKETVLQQFPDFEFISVNESDEYLAKEIREAYLYKSLVPDVNKIVDLMSNNKTDKAIDIIVKARDKIIKTTTIEPVDLIEQAQIRYDEYVNKCNDQARAYVTTGLPELDEILGGWDRQEELAVICAKTNQGKSWWLLFFALHAAIKGLKVGIYSGEMEPSKLGYRIDTFLFNISNWAITHGDINTQVQYKDSIQKIKNLVKNSILVVTPEMFEGNATVTKLRAFIERSELDMLCIDQLSLMDDERRGKQGHEAFANIAKDLKNLQVMKHIPILAVAQLNRQDNENGITIENIAGSYDIMRYATTGILLEQKDKDDQKIKRLVLTIGKARDARVGSKLTYMWDINYGKLTFVPTENDATAGSHIEELKEEFGDVGENIF
ncbi:DnaB-like helicase C-terminal domain-containing protein [uncultured Clostridium sp.]|uniref:DnaB-like helicase C-terminal domain-containing protein n=1 Tax=uncultured Clostridium sp. TaxID=59620 RepID=UPI002608A4B3|nr:DnaB-like helicase C-terminal domain-containing protein [uncultured Clostridium sp.]